MGNDLVTVSMKNYLSSPAIAKYIEEILHEGKGSFVATITTLVNGNDKLQACNKQTILMAALKAQALKLAIEPSLGQAYIVPYGDQATFQIGYRGIIALATRSQQYEMIGGREVKEGEFRGYNMVGDPIIQWDSPDSRFNKKTIGYMAGFQLTSGFSKTSFWSLTEIDKHANTYSQSYKNFKKFGASQSSAKSGNMTNPWISNPEEMSIKTVLKNLLSKYGVLSIELLQEAVRVDQSVITINDQGEEEIKYIDNQPAESSFLSKEKQELLLKSYSPDILKEALFNVSIEDITQLSDESINDFIRVCENIKKENKAVSGDKQIELK